MTRLHAMKVSAEVEIDMVVAADSEGEALEVARRFAKKEASYMSLDVWADCEADVEREIRSLDDLPEDFDVDCAAWDKNGVVQADLEDMIANVPPEPERGPMARAKAALRDRLLQAKASINKLNRGRIERLASETEAGAASDPPAGGGL